MFDHGRTPSEVGFDPAAHGDADLVERASELERQRTMLDAEEAAVLAELDARGVCDRDFGLKTASWLARDAVLPAPVAKARVRVAVKLRRWFPLVADALASGEISWDHARVIVEAANPRIIDVVADHQIMLLTLAQRCRFEPWRAEVHALARLWDQDGGYYPNEDPASNRLSHAKTLDGLTSLAATLTGDNGEVVTHAIEAKADELYRRAVHDHQACPELAVPPRATLRALALTELIRHALGVDLDSSKPPRVETTMVTTADDPTSASDPDGVPLADGTTRVLSCDSVFIPLIVDHLGVPSTSAAAPAGPPRANAAPRAPATAAARSPAATPASPGATPTTASTTNTAASPTPATSCACVAITTPSCTAAAGPCTSTPTAGPSSPPRRSRPSGANATDDNARVPPRTPKPPPLTPPVPTSHPAATNDAKTPTTWRTRVNAPCSGSTTSDLARPDITCA